ncbi:MAG: PDZ domain-containing protein [Deltaproteobacteria bacterium]|nr:MAG: PDZ domain-containing protein [Deltaproteobacteria bacterium]
MRHPGAPIIPSGARRRWAMVAGVVLALAAFLAWRQSAPRAPAGAASQPAPLPAERATPPPAPRSQLPAPAIQLAKRVEIRPARNLAPGALEGTVLDAETNARIAGAELTFSHDNGAWSTTTGPGGAFRFAPRTTGTYRLVSIEARSYASFEGEFGSSPVSFTSTEGNDISGVVLRLTPEDKARPRRRGRRSGSEPVDAGDVAPAARGSLRGRVVDARTGAPVVAFAIALWRRDGIALSRMLAPASFLNASGAYEITDLDPGTYEATAMAAGYAWSGYAVAQVDTSPVQADFALRAGARVEGIVTEDTTRLPIAGAVISLEGRRAVAPNLPVAPLSPEAETGADGRFILEQVPPDAMSLYAQKEGYLTRILTLGPLPEEGDYPPVAIGLTPRASGDDASVELTGIGAVLEARREWLAVVNVVPGGGATDAGLVSGDQILAIDGTPVARLGYEGSIGVIRGAEGTTVVLRIRRDERESDVVVTRKRVRH